MDNLFAKNHVWKPAISTVLPTVGGKVLSAAFVPNTDTIITSTDDYALHIFQNRSDRYWLSKTQLLTSNVHTLNISPSTHNSELILYAGQENGAISLFALTEDTNSMVHRRDILSHHSKVTGLSVDLTDEWLVSVSEDKTLVLTCLKLLKEILIHNLDSAATCMVFDESVRYCFIGDCQGNITILNLNLQGSVIDVTIINTLKSHSAAITDLSWHPTNFILASSSKDNVIIIWDIGGGKGNAFDLHAHNDIATSVCWWLQGPSILSKGSSHNNKSANLQRKSHEAESILVSTALDGKIIFWQNNSERRQSTKWTSSNSCQICGGAFIWNFTKMFEELSIGSRQHHCRSCGKAVCNKCSPTTSKIPFMGYELAVRICTECQKTITEKDKKSMAYIINGNDMLTKIIIDEAHNRMLLVSRNSSVKIMNLK